jgi:outer membrane lipoprotein-sorting protein
VDFRVDGDRGILRLKPRGGEEFLTGLELVFLTGQGHLKSLEMTFRDGSSMRNEFHNVEVNRPLPADTFAVEVTGYQVRDASR